MPKKKKVKNKYSTSIQEKPKSSLSVINEKYTTKLHRKLWILDRLKVLKFKLKINCVWKKITAEINESETISIIC